MITKAPATWFLERLICDVAGCGGDMIHDGRAIMTRTSAKYPHICSVCHVTVTLDTIYPKLAWEVVQ